MTIDTQPSITVRRRTPSDIPALCTLLEKQRPVTGYPEIWPLPFPVQSFIERKNEADAWVAEIGGEVVGHIALGHVKVPRDSETDVGETEARIWAGAYKTTDFASLRCIGVLFTDSDRPKTGIGAALVKAAIQSCRDDNTLPVLECIKEKTHNVEYYRRRGWVIVGEAIAPWFPEKRLDLVLMILPEFLDR